ncbi:MAG: hypothetical protein EON52_23270 [Actinomycetales bacterium]|nr:MAG: hypothetical protein EON52_23270 [Actinomycetales bacterium]
MKRLVLGLVAAGMTSAVLTGCGGGGSPYCDTVKKNSETLNSFGKTKSNAAYTKYASTFRSIAKESPTTVKKDWTALATATDTVLAAQKDVGLKLEQMTSAAAVKKLSTADLKKLNTAYKAFNATSDQRTAVVKNVKQECKITLT